MHYTRVNEVPTQSVHVLGQQTPNQGLYRKDWGFIAKSLAVGTGVAGAAGMTGLAIGKRLERRKNRKYKKCLNVMLCIYNTDKSSAKRLLTTLFGSNFALRKYTKADNHTFVAILEANLPPNNGKKQAIYDLIDCSSSAMIALIHDLRQS